MSRKIKVVHMVTSGRSIGLMRGQLKHLVNEGYDVTVIGSPDKGFKEAAKLEKVRVKEISMERTISPIKDLISLLQIIYFFIKLKPDICNAGTPKAGLLGMIAAKITRVPLKVYTNRGIPFEGSTGFKRRILQFTEFISCNFADKVICISPSVREVLLENKLTSKEKTVVFGIGSSNGLQLERFDYTEKIKKQKREIQRKYKLDNYEFIIGYVGRINNFKGAEETILAFEELQKENDKICLMLVGSKEKKDSIRKDINDRIINNPDIIEVGRVSNPVPYYYIMDVLSFPTHREGFGNVSIESQVTGTPVVTTNATGSVDSVLDNETGIIVDVGTIQELKQALQKFIENPDLKKEFGKRGKEWVTKNFKSEDIWKDLESLYVNNLNNLSV